MRKILIMLLTWICFTTMAFADDAVFSGTVLEGQGGPFDFYGDHMAVNNDWIMVSAPRESIDFDGDGIADSQGDVQAGSLYIYRRTAQGPVLHQRIEGEGNNVFAGTSGDRFGAGLTLSGDWLFVGAANDDNFGQLQDPTQGVSGNIQQPFFFAGKVYVFRLNSESGLWELTQKLSSDEPNSMAAFGARTDASHVELFSFGASEQPTIALIGELENGLDLQSTMHVYKRQRNGTRWNRIQKVPAPLGVSQFADKIEGVGQFAIVSENPSVEGPFFIRVYRVSPNGVVTVRGELAPVQSLEAPDLG